jgi:hypothetical protein
MSAPQVAALLFAPIGLASVREFVRYHRQVEARRVRRIINAAERDGRVSR